MLKDEMIAKLMEQVSVDKENTKVYIVGCGRGGGKTLVQQQIADEIRNKTGLTVFLIDSKEQVSVSEQEKAIVLEDICSPNPEEMQQAYEKFVEYVRPPVSIEQIVKETTLRQNKMQRDQIRFRKRQQRRSSWK